MAGLFRCGSSSIGDVDHHPAALRTGFHVAVRLDHLVELEYPVDHRLEQAIAGQLLDVREGALLTDSSLRSRPISG